MKAVWLGQAGLLLDIDGLTVVIDPYLSNSVGELDPTKNRRVPVDEYFLHINPDVVICTHNHLDHTDPATLWHYLRQDKCVQVLASNNAWEEIRRIGGNHNYILFNRHTEITIGNVRFRAVKAEHSDPCAIGVIIEAFGKNYYITGDTLYNADIFEDLNTNIDVVFLPVNGVGNNMNMVDAKRFCEMIDAKCAVPIHCGLFDDIDMNHFGYEPKSVPLIYKEIVL